MSPGNLPKPRVERYGYKRPIKINITPMSIKIFVILDALALS